MPEYGQREVVRDEVLKATEKTDADSRALRDQN